MEAGGRGGGGGGITVRLRFTKYVFVLKNYHYNVMYVCVSKYKHVGMWVCGYVGVRVYAYVCVSARLCA